MDVLATIVPVIVSLLLGKLISMKNQMSLETIKEVKWLISDIMLPIVIFNSLLTASFTKDSFIVSLGVYFIFTVVLLLGIKFRNKEKKHPLSCFLYSGAEGGMLGYPLYIALFSGEALSNLLVIDLGNILYAFTFFIVLIQAENNRNADKKSILINSLKSPLLIITFVALSLNIFGVGRWFMETSFFAIYRGTVSLLTAPVTMLVLLTVGYDLSFRKDTIIPVLKECLYRFVIMSISAIIILLLFKAQLNTRELIVAVILYFVLPPQFITSILVQDKEERTFIATMISFYVLITVFAFIIIASVLPQIG